MRKQLFTVGLLLCMFGKATAQSSNILDTVYTLRDGQATATMPVRVIKGIEPGPTFAIVAGIHGYEYPPIMATQQIMQSIDPAKLHGILIFVPLANTAAFYGRTPFLNPIDQKNLNNAFPGKKKGTITEQIAYTLRTEVMDISDYFLDIHAGDANENLLPFACFYNNTLFPAQTKAAEELCRIAGFEYVVSYPYTLQPTDPAKYAFKQASQQGIVALSLEAGELGNVQASNVQLLQQAVMNMLQHVNMYPSSQSLASPTIKMLRNQSYVRVPVQGIFTSSIQAGDAVQQGQTLGHIHDVFGKLLATITAPNSGIVLYKIGTPPVNEGETLFCIGTEE
ncbi:succinylglutamate desuccinylase/aspartoacylase family protein [Chitinophaga skermanii]|nr:succinylglutamate desuccinylase/aspartoacylase family protein [Chitinophaga skermanii]